MTVRADLQRAREDVGVFADLVGRPLAPWQASALRLQRRFTVVQAPRQSGKSRSLAVLALWWAYRRRDQHVLIVSAGEEAAKRLLAEASRVATGSRWLAGSVVDELAGLITLSNGSAIRSVPASEKAIRGWTTDLLLVDEAAYVDDDLLWSAAIPTTAARRDARVVLASSPAAMEGAFYEFARQASTGSEDVQAFRWALTDAEWISEALVAAAREAMAPAQFEREFLGEFADVGADERVVDRRWVDAARGRRLRAAPAEVFGLDVARQGGDESVLVSVGLGRERIELDESVFIRRRDVVARVVWAVREPDLMRLAARVRASVGGGVVFVDVTGLGYGVLDRLSQQRVRAVSFVAAGRPSNLRRWLNQRSEAWWHARELFRGGLVDLDDRDRVLAEQLAGVRYGLAPSGAIQIESKAHMRVSPDRADALVIALWAARQVAPGGPGVAELVGRSRPHPLLASADAAVVRRPAGLWRDAGNGLTLFDGEPVSGLSMEQEVEALRDAPADSGEWMGMLW